ncbi:MAG: hypothetical protein PHI28_16480 [Mangrovibacterium sp.]|nr:hypothetical protein [Mangrovibacterium sp.]
MEQKSGEWSTEYGKRSEKWFDEDGREGDKKPLIEKMKKEMVSGLYSRRAWRMAESGKQKLVTGLAGDGCKGFLRLWP